MGLLDPPAITAATTSKATRPVTIPAGLGWASSPLPSLAITVPALPGLPGSVSVTPEAAFDAFSAARSTPSQTIWVDNVGGNDTTGTGAQGTPYQTIDKARAIGAAAGGTTKIMVKATGTPYARNQMLCFQASLAQDVALIAWNGRVVTGSFDQFTAPSLDATQTNTYSWALTNAGRVMDIARLDRFGNYVELTNVPSPARCNITPNSWHNDGTKTYVNRADGAAVTNANTRVYRSAGNSPVQMTVPFNLYMGGLTATDGFDWEGSPSAVLNVQIATASTASRAIVANNCSFKYGSVLGGNGQNVEVDSLAGLAYFSGCRWDAAMTDGFNLHNSKGSSRLWGLTVNCSGYDNGRGANGSCNGWTHHDDCRAIDVCGDYWGNHGGSVASVNIAKALMAGTRVRDDVGDVHMSASNSIPATAFYVRDTCEYWLDSVLVDMGAGTRAYWAMTASTSAIHLRNCYPTRAATVPTGTVDSY